jgi:hypothetical protein
MKNPKTYSQLKAPALPLVGAGFYESTAKGAYPLTLNQTG